MKVAVIGGGGREHMLIRKIAENPEVDQIYAIPGNGGMAEDAVCVRIPVTDMDGVVGFCVNEKIDYAVVAPDDPLAAGMVDRLTEVNIPCFGPDAKAAVIESSKIFAKRLMKKYGIPTADFEVFESEAEALAYLETADYPLVVKADGLALGKGVTVASTKEEAAEAVRSMMSGGRFGKSGERILIEECLTGPEVSVLSFTDGKTLIPMVSSMDHKRAGDNDTGANTGGMGTVAPNPYYTESVAKRCMDEIFLPTVKAMNFEGRTFKGCLYFGLMLTKDGPKVIEYNCRFGDPETQVVLPLLESDLLTVMRAVTDGKLSETEVRFKDAHACCVIMASDGYPGSYNKGYEICLPEEVRKHVSSAGILLKDGKLYTNGGRVLGVTAVADSLSGAIDEAYRLVGQITFGNEYYRHDIGKRALEAKE